MDRTNEEILIGEEERIRHDALFYSQCPDDGLLLSGERARSLFIKSKLPLPDLSKIWKLSDTTRDNMLDEGEFVVAMHLIQQRLCGFEIPESIPAHSRPTSRPLLVIAQANEQEIEAYSNIFDWLRQLDDEYLDSERVLGFLIKSELPTDVLAKIWDLSDIDRDGRINKDELYIAVHLTRFCKNSNSDLGGSIDVLSILPKKSAGESIQDKRRRRTEYQTEIRKLTSLRYKLKSELTNAKITDNMAARKKIQCELDVVSRQLDAVEEKETAVRDEIYKMNTSTSITTNIEVLRPFDRSFLMKRQLSGADFLKQMKNSGNHIKFDDIKPETFLQDNILEFARNLPKNVSENRRNSTKNTKEEPVAINNFNYSSDDESEANELGERRRKRSRPKRQSDRSPKEGSESSASESENQISRTRSRRSQSPRNSQTESIPEMDKNIPKSSNQSENDVLVKESDVNMNEQKDAKRKESSSSSKRSTSALEIFHKIFSSDSEGSSEKNSPSNPSPRKGVGLQKSPWNKKRNTSASKVSSSEEEKEKSKINTDSQTKSNRKLDVQLTKSDKKQELSERKMSPEPVASLQKPNGIREDNSEQESPGKSKLPSTNVSKNNLSSEGDDDVFVDRTRGSFLMMKGTKDPKIDQNSKNFNDKRVDSETSSIKEKAESKVISMKKSKKDEVISKKESKEDKASSKKEAEGYDVFSKKEVRYSTAISKKEVEESDVISKQKVKVGTAASGKEVNESGRSSEKKNKKDEISSKKHAIEDEAISKKEVTQSEAISQKEVKAERVSEKEMQVSKSKGIKPFSLDLIDMLEETLVDSEGDIGGRDTTTEEEVTEDEIKDSVLVHEESERSFDFLDMLEESNLDSKEEVLHREVPVEESADDYSDYNDNEVKNTGHQKDDYREELGITAANEISKKGDNTGDVVPLGALQAEGILEIDDDYRDGNDTGDRKDDYCVKMGIRGNFISTEEKIRPKFFKGEEIVDSAGISGDSSDSETYTSHEEEPSANEGYIEEREKYNLEEAVDAEGCKTPKKTKKVLKTKSGHIVRSRSLHGLRSRAYPDRYSFVEECEWLDGLVKLELEAREKKRRAQSQSSVSDSPWTVTDPLYETWLNSRRVHHEFSRSETIDERALDLASSRALVKELLDMEIAYRNEGSDDVKLRDKSLRMLRNEEFLERRKSLPVGKDILLAAEAISMAKKQNAGALNDDEVALTENMSRDISNAEIDVADAANGSSKKLTEGSAKIRRDLFTTGESLGEPEENFQSKEISERDTYKQKDDRMEDKDKPLKSIKVFKEMFESSTTSRPVDKYKSTSHDMKPRSSELTRSKSLGDTLVRPHEQHIAVREKQKSVDLGSRDLGTENAKLGKTNPADIAKKLPTSHEEGDQISFSSPNKVSDKVTAKGTNKDIEKLVSMEKITKLNSKPDKFSPKKTKEGTEKISATVLESNILMRDSKAKTDDGETGELREKATGLSNSIDNTKNDGFSPEIGDKSKYNENNKTEDSNDEITALKSVGQFRQLFEKKPTENGHKRALKKCVSETGGVSPIDANATTTKRRSQSLKQAPKSFESPPAKEVNQKDPDKKGLSREDKTKQEHRPTDSVKTHPVETISEHDEPLRHLPQTSDLNDNDDDDHIPSIKDRLVLFQAGKIVEKEVEKRGPKIRKIRPKSYHGKSLADDDSIDDDVAIKSVSTEKNIATEQRYGIEKKETLGDEDGFIRSRSSQEKKHSDKGVKVEKKQRYSRETNAIASEEAGFIRSRSNSNKMHSDKGDKKLSELGEIMLGGGSDASKTSNKQSRNAVIHKTLDGVDSNKSNVKFKPEREERKAKGDSVVSAKAESKTEKLADTNSVESNTDRNLYTRLAKDDRFRKELEEQEERDLEIRRQIQSRENTQKNRDSQSSKEARPVGKPNGKADISRPERNSPDKVVDNRVNTKDTRDSMSKNDDLSLPDYRSLVQNDRVRKEIEEQEKRENELKQRATIFDKPTVEDNNNINGIQEQNEVANKKVKSEKQANQKQVEHVKLKNDKSPNRLEANEKGSEKFKNEGQAVNLKTKKMPSKIEQELEAERKRELELAKERQMRLDEHNEIVEKEKRRLEMIEAEKIRMAEEEEAKKQLLVEEKMKRQSRTRGLRAMFETN